MEFLILHLIKYLLVALVLFFGGFPRGQAIAISVVFAFLELSLKIWLGQQFIAIYDAVKSQDRTSTDKDLQK